MHAGISSIVTVYVHATMRELQIHLLHASWQYLYAVEHICQTAHLKVHIALGICGVLTSLTRT